MLHDATKVCSRGMRCIVLHRVTPHNASGANKPSGLHLVEVEHVNEQLAWPWTMSAHCHPQVVFDPDWHACEAAFVR